MKKVGLYKKLEPGEKALLRGNTVEIIEIGPSLTRVIYEGGDRDNPFSVKTADLRPLKLTVRERFFAQVAVIHASRLSYYIAGWIAGHPESIFHVSTPPKDTDKTIEELDAHKVDYVLGQTLTETTEKTMGRTFTVRTATPDKSVTDLYFTETGVVASVYFETSLNIVSLNAKEFVLGFLLDELRFKLGKTQDLTAIRLRVPAAHLPSFEDGLAGIPYKP